MFVPTLKTLILASAALSLGSAGTAFANSGEVPLTLTLTDVRVADVPLYISVQTKADYRSMKGSGVILKDTDASTITTTVNVPSDGDYAISIWHDLDDDGRFSMNERYEIEDGWATSGNVPRGAAPTFEDAKISIPAYGTNTSLQMIYPETS